MLDDWLSGVLLRTPGSSEKAVAAGCGLADYEAEIVKAQDFLKYVAHWGRDLHFKTC